MQDFLLRNTAAVFGLLGVFAGGLLSSITAWLLRRRDLTLKVWEKLLERRIAAHEKIIALAVKMRVMVSLGGIDENGQVRRAPELLMSKEAFEAWIKEYAETMGPATTWLSTTAKREVNLVQDYFVTLFVHFSSLTEAQLRAAGEFIRQDFIDLSSSLEKAAFLFFEREVTALQVGNLAEHHKYTQEDIQRRLSNTVLLSKWAELRKALQQE